jgi:hypothetical protein
MWGGAHAASTESVAREGSRDAYWGIAQSLLANPFNPTPPKNLLEGRAAI